MVRRRLSEIEEHLKNAEVAFGLPIVCVWCEDPPDLYYGLLGNARCEPGSAAYQLSDGVIRQL